VELLIQFALRAISAAQRLGYAAALVADALELYAAVCPIQAESARVRMIPAVLAFGI
jgi:hypothetical protein